MTLSAGQLIAILAMYDPDAQVFIGTDERFEEGEDRPTVFAFTIQPDDISPIDEIDEDEKDFRIGDVLITARVGIGDEIDDEDEDEDHDGMTPEELDAFHQEAERQKGMAE